MGIKRIRSKSFFPLVLFVLLGSVLSCSESGFSDAPRFSLVEKGGVPDAALFVDRKKSVISEKVYLEADDQEQIPVFIVKPDSVYDYPCVLCIHGITASSDEVLIPGLYGKLGNLTDKLLQSGFAVVTFDVRLHGERMTMNYPDFQSHFEDVIAHWDNVFDGTLRDIETIHDYLKTRDDLTAERLNIFGYSMGGMFAFALADEVPHRLRAVCAAATPIQRELVYPGVPQLYASHIKEVPFLMIAATEDPNYSMRDAQWIYEQVGSSNKSLQVYGVGHDLSEVYVHNTASWFVNYN